MACALTVTLGAGPREPWPNAKTHHRPGMNNMRPARNQNNTATSRSEPAGLAARPCYPAQSPSVVMASQAHGHGSGSYQIGAHDPVASGRDSTAVTVLTTGG